MNKPIRLALSALAVAFGIFMFFFGGYDDSPGAQLLGVVLAALGVWGFYKARKNR